MRLSAIGSRPPAFSARLSAVCLGTFLAACAATPPVYVPGGDATRGREALAATGCGSCHEIGGVRGARGRVGPPLDGIAGRAYIAGQLPNTPENLVRWILDPPAVEPGTAMPKLVNDERSARDIAAYLYTLR